MYVHKGSPDTATMIVQTKHIYKTDVKPRRYNTIAYKSVLMKRRYSRRHNALGERAKNENNDKKPEGGG